MKIRSLCLCMLVLSAPLAQASIQLDAISCSSSLSLNDRNGVSFDCGGDLSLSGCTVSAETGDLLINAAGTLSLSNMLLGASNITISGNAVYIADDVNIETTDDGDNTDRLRIYSNLPPDIVNQGSDIGIGTMELASAVFLSSGRNISLSGGIEASRGNKVELSAGAGIRTVSDGGFIQYGGEITIFASRGEIKLGEGGISGLSNQVVNPVFIQGTPVTIPIPAAFSQLLLGLSALCTPALKRKKIVN